MKIAAATISISNQNVFLKKSQFININPHNFVGQKKVMIPIGFAGQDSV